MTRDDKKGQVGEDATDIYLAFFVPALFKAWPKKLVATTTIMTGASVLDVTCGTGVLARYIATQVVAPEFGEAVTPRRFPREKAFIFLPTPRILWPEGAD